MNLPILRSQHNFRDLGGIPAAGGRKVRPGLLYRSGDLSNLTAEDLATLESINLSMVIDFRAKRETESRPNKQIGTVREVVHIGIHDAAREPAEKFLQENDAKGLETLLVRDYSRMITEHRDEFRRFIAVVTATPNVPLVYHCAAGKDRTGLATVFLLTALGVAMEDIRTDYMATNEHTRIYVDKVIRKITDTGLNGEILRPMFEVRPEYLDAALIKIEENWGSLEEFVTDELGADRIALQNRFLEN